MQIGLSPFILLPQLDRQRCTPYAASATKPVAPPTRHQVPLCHVFEGLHPPIRSPEPSLKFLNVYFRFCSWVRFFLVLPSHRRRGCYRALTLWCRHENTVTPLTMICLEGHYIHTGARGSAAPVVCKLVFPHSVFELSTVPILAWSGVGCLDFCMCCVLPQFVVQPGGGGGHRQNHDWTAPPPPLHSIAVLHS